MIGVALPRAIYSSHLYVEREVKTVKDAAWVKDSGLLDDVQDNWDVESESDAEQAGVTKASPQKIGEEGEGQGHRLTKREQRRLESASKDDPNFAFEQNHLPQGESEADRERQVRLGDLEHTMDLMGIRGSEEYKRDIVEAGLTKRTTATTGNVPSAIAQRVLTTTKDVDDLVKHITSRELFPHSTSKLYPTLLETLFREICNTREVPELRRLASIVSDIAASKQKAVTKKKPQIEMGSKKSSQYDMDDYDDDSNDDHD